jgi:hypothetical protein
VQQPFEDLAKISSYSNVVTSVWHVQMGSKVDQDLAKRTVHAQQPFKDLSNFAWFAQIRNMSRGHFFGK